MSNNGPMQLHACSGCGGVHESDPPDSWVDVAPLEGEPYRITWPFRCICCGVTICARQFAFGASCGKCDVGACQPRSYTYRESAKHDNPPWWEPEPPGGIPYAITKEGRAAWMARKRRIWDRFAATRETPA